MRDTEQARVLQSRLSAKEARREAEMIVRREEEGRRRRLAQEEQLVREQMSAIRRQMRERERERRCADIKVSHMKALGVVFDHVTCMRQCILQV